MVAQSEPAFTDSGERTAVVQFPFDEVDRNLSPTQPTDDESLKESAVKFVESLMRFIWQDAKNNPQGLQIRAMIVCWQILEELAPMTETELALGFGMKKQSVGRWVEQFKKEFPHIRSPHIKQV